MAREASESDRTRHRRRCVLWKHHVVVCFGKVRNSVKRSARKRARSNRQRTDKVLVLRVNKVCSNLLHLVNYVRACQNKVSCQTDTADVKTIGNLKPDCYLQ